MVRPTSSPDCESCVSHQLLTLLLTKTTFPTKGENLGNSLFTQKILYEVYLKNSIRGLPFSHFVTIRTFYVKGNLKPRPSQEGRK